jgi:hypothetical protein
MGVFDEIIKRVGDEGRQYLEKDDVKQYLASLEEDLRRSEETVQAWEEYLWGRQNPDGTRTGGIWDDEKKNFKPVIEARQKIEEQEAELARLRQLVEAGSDMTFDEILENLQKRGFVTREQIAEIEQRAKQAVTRDDLGRVTNAFEFFYTKTAGLPAAHLAEFGKPLNFEDYLEFARKQNMVSDPMAAYEAYVRPMRQEIEAKRRAEEQERIQREIEEAKRKGIEEGKRLASMGETGIPADQVGPGTAYSPAVAEALKSAVKPDGTVKPPEGSKLGDGVRAALAAQLLRQGKLTGPVQ